MDSRLGIAEFMGVCERAAAEAPLAHCPGCGAVPAASYERLLPARRGFQFECVVPVRGQPCGVVICGDCGYLLAVGLGMSRAVRPAADDLREIVSGPLGDYIAALQRAARLGGRPPQAAIVQLTSGRG